MSEYSKKEIEEAIEFVIRDNPGRKWSSNKEFLNAVENYLAEDTVVSNLEQCIKDGLVEEIAPNQFVATKKGLELAKQLEKENGRFKNKKDDKSL